MKMRNLVCGLCCALLCGAADSQPYPAKPVRIISTVTAGGPQDSLARMVAPALSSSLGQPVLVENRTGAGSTLGAAFVAKALPDGYTLLLASASALSSGPALYSRLAYDADKDFAAITQLVEYFSVVYVSNEVPAKSIKEFVAYAKARPGKLNYGSYGIGSSPHFDALHLLQLTDLDMIHIPYKGAQDTYPALITNQIQLGVFSLGSGLPHVKAAKIRALGIAGPRRMPALPEISTFAEAGIPFTSTVWFGLAAPTGVPGDIINRLAAVAAAYVKSPAFAEQASRFGFEPVGSTPSQFATFLKAERERFRGLAERHNIRLD